MPDHTLFALIVVQQSYIDMYQDSKTQNQKNYKQLKHVFYHFFLPRPAQRQILKTQTQDKNLEKKSNNKRIGQSNV